MVLIWVLFLQNKKVSSMCYFYKSKVHYYFKSLHKYVLHYFLLKSQWKKNTSKNYNQKVTRFLNVMSILLMKNWDCVRKRSIESIMWYTGKLCSVDSYLDLNRCSHWVVERKLVLFMPILTHKSCFFIDTSQQ